jgi:hypothetical protein
MDTIYSFRVVSTKAGQDQSEEPERNRFMPPYSSSPPEKARIRPFSVGRYIC